MAHLTRSPHYVEIIDHFWTGGAQKMVALLARNLAERNVRVTVISLADDAASPVCQAIEACGIQVAHFPSNKLLDPARILKIVRFLRANDFTLLHSYLTYANVVMCIAGTLARVPVIASLRNIKPNPEYYNPVIYRIETFCLRHLARRVMANGYAIGDLNRARVGKEIVVIPNSIEVPARLPEAERTRLRKALGGDAHRTIVISVGRLVAVKGFPMIIDAVHQLRSRFPDLLLLIAGDGDQQAELENQVAALQLQDHVRLLGKRDDVPALLDASDVYVSASSMEGMSVAILEAMAAGLPVIATDTGDAARVVVAGTGFIIPVGQIQPLVDGLAALLADAPGRAQMGSAARERVASTYNTTAWTDQFLKLYQEIAEK